jgi:hypothetical protein
MNYEITIVYVNGTKTTLQNVPAKMANSIFQCFKESTGKVFPIEYDVQAGEVKYLAINLNTVCQISMIVV